MYYVICDCFLYYIPSDLWNVILVLLLSLFSGPLLPGRTVHGLVCQLSFHYITQQLYIKYLLFFQILCWILGTIVNKTHMVPVILGMMNSQIVHESLINKIWEMGLPYWDLLRLLNCLFYFICHICIFYFMCHPPKFIFKFLILYFWIKNFIYHFCIKYIKL